MDGLHGYRLGTLSHGPGAFPTTFDACSIPSGRWVHHSLRMPTVALPVPGTLLLLQRACRYA